MRQSVAGKWSRRKRMKLLRENAELKARISFPITKGLVVHTVNHPVREFMGAMRCLTLDSVEKSLVHEQIAMDLAKSLLEHGAIEFKEEPRLHLSYSEYNPYVPITVRGRLFVVMP